MNWLELISERVDFDSILHLTSSKLVNFLQSDISWTQSSFSELYHWLHFSSLVSHQQLLSLQLSLTLQYPFTNSKQSKYSQTTMAVANHWNGCANDFSFCFVWWQQKEQWDKVNISTEKRIAYFLKYINNRLNCKTNVFVYALQQKCEYHNNLPCNLLPQYCI